MALPVSISASPRFPRRWATLLCAAVVVCAAAPVAHVPAAAADDIDHSPAFTPVRRVVRFFDFEERKLGNFEAMPMHWFRIKGSGYPGYTRVGFDDTIADSGKHSVKLQLNGGSAGVVLEPGVIAVVPDARYRVAARVRTRGVKHTRARIVAEFLDTNRKLLVDTRTESEPTVSENAWTTVSVQLPDAPANAAWMVLRLELVQSDRFGDSALGIHAVAEQDIDTAAWFDDVGIYQLPRIDVATQSPINIHRAPQRPVITSSVHDLTGRKLTAVVTVRDAAGRIVATQERPIADTKPGVWTWTPDLPGYGWYGVDLTVRSPHGIAGRGVVALAWLPPHTLGRHDGADRFVVIAESLPPKQLPMLREIMQRIGPHGVMLTAWRRDMSPLDMADVAEKVDPRIVDLIDRGHPVSMSLTAVPRELAAAAGTDPNRPLDLMTRDPKIWKPHVEALLASHGQYVRNWQLGRADTTEAFERDDLAEVYAEAVALAERFVPDPHLTVPWSALHEITPAARSTSAITLSVPNSVHPARLGDYAKDWPNDSVRMTYRIEPLKPGEFSHDTRATDLALRMVYAWRTNPYGLAIDRPWAQAPGPNPRVIPDPLLAVWSNVASHLAGRRYVGRLRLGDGVEADLLDGPRGGVLAVWSDGSAKHVELDLHLGDKPYAIDMFGNRSEIEATGGRNRMELTTAPRFIHGIDMEIARFRASFRMDPPTVPSIHAVHDRELVVTNPWGRPINGKLRITGPTRWEVRPKIHHFSIPPGGEARLPIKVTFPINETAGEKSVTAHVTLDAEQRHEFDIAAPVKVGLDHIEFRSDLALEYPKDRARGASPDIVLTMHVTNTGDEDDSFYAFATVPGHPRQQRIVAPLKAGQTVVKRFRYPGAGTKLAGKNVRVGLRQTDGPAILNHVHVVP